MLQTREEVDNILYGVWKIEESQDELLAMLHIDDTIEAILERKSASRILEMLAVRVLLNKLLDECVSISYLPSGRPYLEGHDVELSVSHTKGYAAVALHPCQRVAIDIEQMSDKVHRVRSRFIASGEYVDIVHERNHLLLHWSAKEALFKLLDVEGVDFVEHLRVHPFEVKDRGVFRASETKTLSNNTFNKVHYKVEQDYVLVFLADYINSI